jgi:hypothetical protein
MPTDSYEYVYGLCTGDLRWQHGKSVVLLPYMAAPCKCAARSEGLRQLAWWGKVWS